MTEQPPETFADVLNRLMARHGVSQAHLAAELGTYDANVARWRKGRGITPQNAAAIADYFNLDRGYMLGLAGYPANSVAIAQATIDPEISALYDAERAQTHAALGNIPARFHHAILDAMSQARTLAIRYAQAADEAAEQRRAQDDISLSPPPDLAPPDARASEKRHKPTYRPNRPLSGQYAHAG